ncbi:hypothetical protein OIU76_009449 [Salix suchowensis]|nr:hypothetical protein OIU76_009449 [Salix suchowensis]
MRWVSETEGGESLQARDKTEGQRRETRWVAGIEARDEMGFRDRERRETTQSDRGGEGQRRRGTTWVSGERLGDREGKRRETVLVVKRNEGKNEKGKCFPFA